jgi:hypothetical protein
VSAFQLVVREEARLVEAAIAATAKRNTAS